MSSVGLQLEECVGKTFNFDTYSSNIQFKIIGYTVSRKQFLIELPSGDIVRRKIYYDIGNCNCIKQGGMYCYLRSNRIVNNDTHNDNECVAEKMGKK